MKGRTRIDFTNLEQGTVYFIRYRPLGEVLARLLDKEKLEFEVTEGKLQSQADRKKQWTKGMTFEAIPTQCDFYEVM